MMTKSTLNDEEKLEIVLASMESPRRMREILRQHRISERTLERWASKARKDPSYWKRLPKLPQIRPGFGGENERYCREAFDEIAACAQRLKSQFEARTAEFLDEHMWFCACSLDDRGITHLSWFPPRNGYDIRRLRCEELASSVTASAHKVHHHLSSYAHELQSEYPNFETKCYRLSRRTFLLYTSAKCKPLPKALRLLARAKEEIDWILTTVSPDPFSPGPTKIKFDTYVATDDGTFTTLEYLVRGFRESAGSLRKIKGAEDLTGEIIRRLEGFAEFYSRFV